MMHRPCGSAWGTTSQSLAPSDANHETGMCALLAEEEEHLVEWPEKASPWN